MAQLRRFVMLLAVLALSAGACSEEGSGATPAADPAECQPPATNEAGGSTAASAADGSRGSTAASAADGSRGSTAPSVARTWNEAALSAVRRDFPAPTVHARNLFHLSVAMWDTWAAWEPAASGYLVDVTTDLAVEGRADAISAAAHRLLSERYARAVRATDSLDEFDRTLRSFCLDPVDVEPGSAAAFGVSIAEQVLELTRFDGSNEIGGYADPGGYEPVNPALPVELAYTSMADPNRWQPLELERRFSQNGQRQSESKQTFVGPHWGSVAPFALDPAAAPLPIDPGPPPQLTFGAEPDEDAAFVDGALEVVRYSAVLDPASGETIDLSPSVRGANPLGTYNGTGHAENPATGRPYEPNVVLRGDYGRVVAEFWADGPDSETPPGHWNTLANEVSDRLAADPDFGGFHIGGSGPVVDRLQWDVSLYLALNGAVHDAAIAAWGAKGYYDYSRPISQIRYLAGLGQSSDPDAASYHPQGLPLVDGATRLNATGEIEIRSWAGQPDDPATQAGGVDWIRAGEWVPYQRPTFVTPAFAGYVSGHSAFSRAGAEVLAAITGDEFFPGGLMEWTFPEGGLHFEYGPSTDITLQWATYADAADEAGLSRLYGGIHVRADDLRGRELGAEVGVLAWHKALTLMPGTGHG